MQEIKNLVLENLHFSEKKRIVVAMSGGVDSTTVAALLHEAGHDVIGITLQLYDHGIAVNKKGACCAGIDIYDAQMAAEKIGIPHYVFNYEDIFFDAVMKPFAESYAKGETPIPCILCNQKVKFKDMLSAARDLNADVMATGHYVQRKRSANGYSLNKAVDQNKDQSYFLFTITNPELENLVFPLGCLNKSQTRELASSYNLDIADKPDSQDICFVPNGNYRKIVNKILPDSNQKGDIVLNDTVVGSHDGIINYTIGQRRGLNISYSEPLYVKKIDPRTNQVILGTKEQLASRSFKIYNMNWLDNNAIYDSEREFTFRLRSTHQGSSGIVQSIDDNIAEISIHHDYFGITPGQACVVYDKDRLIGGGWIKC